jgi:hypothetical protein
MPSILGPTGFKSTLPTTTLNAVLILTTDDVSDTDNETLEREGIDNQIDLSIMEKYFAYGKEL